MNKLQKRKHLIILISVVLVFALSCCGSPSEKPSVASTEPTHESIVNTLDGKTLMEERCASCHTTGRITSKSGSLDEWTSTVDRMMDKGVQLNPDERDTLIHYLVETYP